MTIETLEKEPIMTWLTDILIDAKLERNQKAKTYSYVAKLTDYKSTMNINREFIQGVLDFKRNDGWSAYISTSFLNELKPGEILEIGINLKKSCNYSFVSKTYLVVLKTDSDTLDFFVSNTAFRAFKKQFELFGQVSNLRQAS